jgi:hypothetical protein
MIPSTTMSLVGLVLLVSASLVLRHEAINRDRPKLPPHSDVSEAVRGLDQIVERHWKARHVAPTQPADDLLVARRLALALCGTVPSLQEIRWLESLPTEERIEPFCDRLLADPRSHFYLAERLARAMNSSLPAEPFFIYRRRRFVFWLADQIGRRRPYDEIVRECVSGEGLWTDKPGVNFITGHDVDGSKLANRTTRAFLGLRLDCAQCHDHPFAPWKQADFRGLAAWYGTTKLDFRGVRDHAGPALVENPATKEKEIVEPKVPFQPELLPTSGTHREQLAGWLTHPENRYFARAVVNRLWAIMLGKPVTSAVDDLDSEPSISGVLEFLADDLTRHRFDLQRTIRIIAKSEVFRRGSAFQGKATDQQERVFAAFPITRLRSEQAAGAIVQSAKLFTIDDRTHSLLQLAAFGATNDFIERYGDAGENEMQPTDGNVAQRLLMMNGTVVHEQIKKDLTSACQHIGNFAPDNASAVQTAFLICLSRYPDVEETAHFVDRLNAASHDRFNAIEDLLWTLVNSSEFTWNH